MKFILYGIFIKEKRETIKVEFTDKLHFYFCAIINKTPPGGVSHPGGA